MKAQSLLRDRGFTIIELLVVIIIIGILVAITAVSYGGITKSALLASVQSDVRNAATVTDAANASNEESSSAGSIWATVGNGKVSIPNDRLDTNGYVSFDGGDNGYEVKVSSGDHLKFTFYDDHYTIVGWNGQYPDNTIATIA